MTPAAQQQPEDRLKDLAAQMTWARVVNNFVEGLFWLALFALILRACGRI